MNLKTADTAPCAVPRPLDDGENWPEGTASQLFELTTILRNLGLVSEPDKTLRESRLNDRQLAHFASFIWSVRRIRTQSIGADIFGEPAWDMLLDLFCRQVWRQPVFVKGACLSTHVPTTTALRWIEALSARGWVARAADPDDKRRQAIFLTETGMNKVRKCLRDIAYHHAHFEINEPDPETMTLPAGPKGTPRSGRGQTA